ncbi:MAG: hypothetical protein NXI22_01055 [bacterium]|nr:hypothetical protein [bacterium]
MTYSALQSAKPSQPLRLPAWALSAALHATVLILLALIVKAPTSQSTDPPPRPGAVALVQTNAGKVEYFSEDSAAAEQSQAANNDSANQPAGLKSVLPAESEIAVDFASELPGGELGGGLNDGAQGFPAATDLLNNQGGSQAIGEPTKTTVFGLPGSGSKFIYVFDRSASMSGFEGRPLKAAKAELLRSLVPLRETQQFQVIFYNDRPHAVVNAAGLKPKMMWGNQRDKAAAREFIDGVVAAGNTEHLPALQLGLSLGPDVVYFLTDANEPELNEAELRRVREWNRAEAIINTIEFGAGPAPDRHNFLKEIARQNRGQYIYVDVTSLPR